jgi:hypothetical protein
MIILRKGFPENKAIDRLKEKHNIINLSLLQYIMFFATVCFLMSLFSHQVPILSHS